MSKPAIVVPPPDERAVMVGDARCPVSAQEWIATQLQADDRVRITPRSETPYDAVVDFSWFYEGVMLDVVEVRYAMTGGRRTAIPELGDAIRVLDRDVIYELADPFLSAKRLRSWATR